MFLAALLIGSIILGAAIILYVDFLNESRLRQEIKRVLPNTTIVEVNDARKECGKDFVGTNYFLKAHQKDGTKKDVEIRCESGNIKRHSRIRI